MKENEKPMPLSELPGYMDSLRRSGQGDYVPVVDMGRIVDAPSPWIRRMAYMSAACALLMAGGLYTFASSREIRIRSAEGESSITDIIAEGGGRVISVRKDTEGAYRVRVFAFGGIRSLVERLKERKELESVEAKE